SQNVTVALGETANVPFEGELLRTSGISGRVSVEGMGLEGITVTLSMADADDKTAMTDAGGLYAFGGLAAGAYTVSIAVEGDAYVFETMSMDVEVADDQTAIVNFEGTHATTASVSGVVFIDELMKNDTLDMGEHPVAQAGIPVALVGPGVNDQMLGATDEMGAFTFAGLKAGSYQLVFTGAAALPEGFAFGGSAIGYTIALGVGEAHMQNLPIDITHTTINFSVMLKSGDETGDALPGATVDVYADMAGETKIGSGETDDMGMTAITVERARASGNMVYAGVMAPDGFGVGGDMQMVEWDPQYTMTAASNSQDIVNLKAEVSFAGATITTAMGGGEALAGWGIDVTMMGEDGEMVAVEGAPETLDGDGMGSLMMMAESAADLPMTYYVAFDADQDDEMDGGESYETVDAVMHTHTGLSVDTEMDAGTVTARFTTQTLKVSVYREVDQAPGFTGNIGTGDVSATCIESDDDGCVTGVEIELRHETASNRRNTIDRDVWRWDTSGSDQTVWISRGNYTFKNLPTDLNIFVLADGIGHVEIVPTDNLAAYEDKDANGIEGSAFGSEGGYGHTVSLCPGRKVDPTGQDHGECGSFGFVPTHTVAAHVKKMIVEKDSDDGFRAERAINVTGVELGFTPVTGKNIAGEADAATTLKNAVRSAGEGSSSTTWTVEVDERQDLYFGRMAEGVYGFSLTSKWAAVANGAGIGREFRVYEGAVMDVTGLTGADGPFRPGDDTEGVYIEVRPTTGILYGIVLDDADDPLEDVEVTVNGVTVMTDIDGRYIVPDFSKRASSTARVRDNLTVSFSLDGYDTQRDDPAQRVPSHRYQITDADGSTNGIPFEANDPIRLDIVLKESQMLATVTGTVTDKDGDPVSGVDLTVVNEDGDDVLYNKQRLASGAFCTVGEGDAAMNCRRTGDDGTYEMQVKVTEDDVDYTITPSKNRYYFDNTDETERLEVGDDEDGVDFEALRQSRIRGAVKDAEDNGMGGITVTATAQGRDYSASDETNTNGRFTIWVDGDERYDVMPEETDGYSFANPEDEDNLGLRVDDDETHDIGTFVATAVPSDVATLKSLTVQYGTLKPDFAADKTTYTATVGYNVTSTRIEAAATSPAAKVTIAVGDENEMGTGSAAMDVALPRVADYVVTITVDPADEDADEMTYKVTVTRSADQPSAVRNLKAVSSATQSLTLTWEPPLNIAGLSGYQYSVNSTDGENGTWAAATATAVGGSQTIGTTEHAAIANGLDHTYWVRAFIDPDGTPGNADDRPGAATSITAAPWPTVTVAVAPNSVAEADNPATTNAKEDTARVTVSLPSGQAVYSAMRVRVGVVDEDDAELVEFAATEVTVNPGATSASVLVTAVDNKTDADGNPTVEFFAEIMEDEVEYDGDPATAATAPERDRAVTASGSELTITDDDIAPTTPTGVTATQVGTTDAHEVTWTFTTNQWGTGAAESRKFQYRMKEGTGAFGDTPANRALWKDVDGGAGARVLSGLTLAAPSAGSADVVYRIEVRAVSEAGSSEPGTSSGDGFVEVTRTAPSG
ncbi:MAG: cadherin-like beta sandwich domain-containing protein, partial [Gemmatimonadota bacterium]|nr:cadherin-like beta sandwich domain-containing protein [Gemmatimonadota bacterium]